MLEFKEEIVAIQLYIAAKRGLDLLFGPGAVVQREDLAFVSAAWRSPAPATCRRISSASRRRIWARPLIHTRAIGNSALMVVDRERNRAVRVDVVTGVLPKDRELTRAARHGDQSKARRPPARSTAAFSTGLAS